MKKKILSLVFGMFMCVFSLFTLASCSLVSVDDEKTNSAEVLRIGDTVMTKADVVSAFYTYYQNNSNYFSYYGGDAIEQSFYQWLIVRQLVSEKSFEALYDAEENPDGYIYYTKEDAEDVWKSVKEYFYSQVSTKEKSLYEADENFKDETEYPYWLQTADEAEEETAFEPFKSVITEVDLSKRADENLRKKLGEEEVKAMAQQVIDYIYEYVPDAKDLDENDNPKRADIVDTDSIPNAKKTREKAFLNYKTDLVANAKDQGTSVDLETCFKNEIYRIYEAYYNSKISTLFQNYYLYEYLTNLDVDSDGTGDGDSSTLSDKVIVETFLSQYYTDKQRYSSETQYINALTSEDGTTLVLYHFNGVYYYFTIQHILVSFNDYLTNAIQQLPEYNSSTSNDPQLEISQVFKHAREELVNAHKNSMLTKVKFKEEKEETEPGQTSTKKVSLFESIQEFGDYYFYDEDLKDLYGYYWIQTEDEGGKTIELTYEGGTYSYMEGPSKQTVAADKVTEVYNGYIKLSDTVYTSGAGNTITVNRTNREIYQNYSEDEIALYANPDDILNCYNLTFNVWKSLVSTYLQNDETANETLLEEHPDLEYVFNLAEDMTANGSKDVDIYTKLSNLLFVELEWIYSGDTLGNELSNKLGYIVSTKPDDSGSLVVDFANGAKELMNEIKELMTQQSTYSNNEGGFYSQLQAIVLGLDNGKSISSLTKSVITTYGIHILKVNDVYECGASVIDFNEEEIDLTEGSDFIKNIIALLKKTYVSNSSNETLYNYFYEKLYTNYAGTTASNGTYFLSIEYNWLSQLYRDGKIKFTNKLTYDELMDSLT